MNNSLPQPFVAELLKATSASRYETVETIQSLWSGYGQIQRGKLIGAATESVILKHVKPPNTQSHPRGWNSNRSHERKLRSYEVETHWYQHYSARCDSLCRISRLICASQHDGEFLIALEDLDEAGFPVRKSTLSRSLIDACLRWLAEFHATFLGEQATGLWQTGTYWHLETRPDELAAIDDDDLKRAAPVIDAKLSNARYQTFVHGDAKLANFCFARDCSTTDDPCVAAVDFQYVGGGCGMKDVAYFLGSCLRERELDQQAASLLDAYFSHLRGAINRRRPEVDASALVREWRELFHWAWTDFHRFLQGWSPGHWKTNSFSERIASDIVAQSLRS